MFNFLENKIILVTGACGTIGQELIKKVSNSSKAKRIIGIDNNESLLFEHKFLRDFANQPEFYFCDIRNKAEIAYRTKGVDIILHTAAMKHVDISEFSPNEVVSTNILGVQNVISAAFEK